MTGMSSSPRRTRERDSRYDYLDDDDEPGKSGDAPGQNEVQEGDRWFDTSGEEVVARRFDGNGWENMAERTRENVPDDTGGQE